MVDVPSIPEFFRGRSAFITGVTGFMGKVLLEKLLRSCPDIGHIYVIVRPKKQSEPSARLQVLTELPLFDRLKREQPDALQKVTAVCGDMMQLGLGLSEQDRQTLVDNVSVIFNVAATVRFDDPLRDAILMNVRGPREVSRLAADMTQLAAFLHVSTSFSNLDHLRIEERVYPEHADYRRMIVAAETMDDHVLRMITPKLLGSLPNTYTYTKSMGEHVVNDHGVNLPVIIFRPAIVISTFSEPIAGWLDNFNGPMGMMVAAGKGVIRTAFTDPDVVSDYMPVDIAIKSMVIAAWRKGVEKSAQVPVYNCTVGSLYRVSMTEVMDMSKRLSVDYPLNDIIWLPDGKLTNNYTEFYLRTLFLHLLPAVCIDAGLMFRGMKPMLVHLQRRIYVANIALQFFLRHGWDIVNDHFLSLDDSLLPGDRDAWMFVYRDADVDEYLKKAFIGGRKYLLKESDDSIPQAKIHYKRMVWLDRIVKGTFYAVLAYVVHANSLIGRAVGVFEDVYTSLFDMS